MKSYLRSLLPAAGVILFLSLLLAACSGSEAKDDAEALLQTVPADAVSVGVIDLERLIGDLGAKADGTVIKKGDALKKELIGFNSKFDYNSLFDGKSGIRFTSAVFFSDAKGSYLTCLAEDGETLRKYLTEKAGAKWTKEGNLYVADNFVQKGNQLWIVSKGSHESLDEYSELTRARSFLSKDYASVLTACDHGITWYASVNSAIDKAGMSFSERTSVRLVTSMIFDNIEAVAGYADVKENEFEVIAEALDSKGKVAKCNLKFGKIDVKQVAALGGNANTLFAISLPHALIEKLMKSAESFGGTMPALYSNIFLPIDGTVAVASSVTPETKTTDVAYVASIATTGNQGSLMQSLYSLGLKPDSDGNLLKLSSGNYGAGAYKVEDAARKFEGAAIGLVMRGEDGENMTATIDQHDGGLRLKIEGEIPESAGSIVRKLLHKK